jgi:prepilin-type N-terminal cleavage/methylation domain-containing protein
MKKNIHRPGGFTLVELLVVIAIIAALAGLAVPQILRARKSADRAEATNNLKQLGLALFSFEEQYGTFPSRQIYQDNSNQFKNGTGGDTANDLLGMLLAGGFSDSEEIFFAKGGSRSSKKPDNVFNTPANLLEPGECGFGYVMLQGDMAMSTTSNNSGCALAVAPLKPNSGGSNPEFNDKPYDGKAVYLRIDQAVKQNRIDDSGKVGIPGNRTLFDTGPDTVWDTDNPDVKAPK